MSTEWILVGVDGSEASRLAVRYAASQANRLDADLRIVHVVMDLPLAPGMTPMIDPGWISMAQDTGEGFLTDAVTAASEVLDPDRIGTQLLSGDRVTAIVEASEGAALIVLGDERRSFLDRLVVGSVISGVASRATVPVIAVPDRWDGTSDHGTVLVGVKDLEKSGPIIARAAGIAAGRSSKLVVLHAWHLPAAYDDLAISALDRQEFADRAHETLDPAIAEAKKANPGLDVELQVLNGQPAAVLVEASKQADLLVLARRTRHFPVGYLGGTGRALLRESLCPVAVIPPAADQQ